MSQLHIKTEFLPTRCEICHHDDCFDATRNYCSRCAGAAPVDNSAPKVVIDENIQVPGIRQTITLGRDTKIENLVKTSLRWRGEIAPDAENSATQSHIFSRTVWVCTLISATASLISFSNIMGFVASIMLGSIFGCFLGFPIAALIINCIPIVKNLFRRLQQFTLHNEDNHYKHHKHRKRHTTLKNVLLNLIKRD